MFTYYSKLSLYLIIQDIPRPQISMPNQSKGLSSLNDEQDDMATTQVKKESPVKPKPKKQDKPANTGWFGGIWNKLSLRPKNQMKLPDDKNPTVSSNVFYLHSYFNSFIFSDVDCLG